MGNRVRFYAVLAATTALLTACGGSHRGAARHSVGRTSSGQSGAFTATISAPPRTHSGPALTPSDQFALPASTHGPSTCTVFEPGSGTQVILDSQTLDVAPDCRGWAATQPGDGYLWGYERATTIPQGLRICSYSDPHQQVTATVLQETTFIPISTAERARGASACASILASGWTVPARRARASVRRTR